MRRTGGLALLAAVATVGVLFTPQSGHASPMGDAPAQSQWSVDHVVIVVPSLLDAVSEYRKAGFTVRMGGTPAGGFDRNALIAFRDGTYVELYSPLDPGAFDEMASLVESGQWEQAMLPVDPMAKRFARHVADGPGLADLAISRPDLITRLGRECSSLNSAAVPCRGPIDMSRVRPDGVTVRWRVDVLANRSLPFLIADVTPRDVRVPGGSARHHANGASGIASVTLAGPDPARIAADLSKVLAASTDASSARYQFALPRLSGSLGTVDLRVGSSAHRGPTRLVLSTDSGQSTTLRLAGVEIIMSSDS